ncbi:hypothetical protein BOX15_Mlig008752g2, partial [Macrostomum lignano]
AAMVEPAKIVLALKATLNPKQQREAEVYLDSMKKIIAFCPTLLDIVMWPEVDIPVRQAGAVYLKNTINRFWRERAQPEEPGEPLQFSLHEQDKARIRASLVQAMLLAPEPLRQQLKVCVTVAAQSDFPGRWSEELPAQLAAALSADIEDQVPGALSALHALLKVFQYAKPDRRVPLESAMATLLPLLHRRLLLAVAGGFPLAQQQCLAVKAFHAYTCTSLPPALEADRGLVMQWTEALGSLLRAAPPPDCPQSDDHPWWRARKWAARSLLNWLERFGSRDTLCKRDPSFGDWYVRTAAGPVLQLALEWLDRFARREFVPQRLLHQLLNYLRAGLAYAHLWRLLKPHMRQLLAAVCFPLLCFTDDDAELWDADPVEYLRVRRHEGDWEDVPAGADLAAEELLHEACAKRRHVLDWCVAFCTDAVNATSAEADSNDAAARQRDGALRILGSLADLLVSRPAYAAGVESFMTSLALPMAASPRPFLRARACCLLRQFAEARGAAFEPATLSGMADAVRLRLLDEPELPVKMEAALALEALIDHQPGADAVLQPHAAPIIGQLLDAMRRTVSEELNTVLCKVFLRHAKHIGPLATSIVQQLGDAFTRLHGEDADTAGLDDAVEEDRMLLAMGLLDTLADVTDAVRRSDARLLSQLEPLLINIVKFIFDANLAEFHEQAAALAHRLVRRRTLSPTVWQLLSIIGAYIARDGDFVDTFVEFVATLHCLVTASSDGSGGDLLAEASRPAQLLAICERILGEDTSCEEAQEGAARLLETALLQFPGRLDQGFVQRALTAAAKRMELQAASASAQSAAASTASEDVALACLRVCLAGLLHWPELALSLLPADQLVASYERLHRRLVCLHDRRLCVLAFCSLLSLRPDLAKPLLPALLRLFSGLRASYRLKARLEADGDCGDGDSSDGEGESEEAGDSSRAAAAVVAAPQRELDSDEDEAFEDQSAAEADQTDAGLGDALGNGVGDQVDDGQDSADPDGLDNLDDLGRPPFSTRLERPLDAADALRLDEFLAVSRTVPAVCPPDALAALDAEAASCLNYVLAEAESRQRQAAANSASLP